MLRQARENGISPPVLQGNEMADLRTFLASLRYFEPTGSPLVGERVFSERGSQLATAGWRKGHKLVPGLGPAPKLSPRFRSPSHFGGMVPA